MGRYSQSYRLARQWRKHWQCQPWRRGVVAMQCLTVVLGLVLPLAAVSADSNDDPSDPVAGREHWAFRPLSHPAVPRVADLQWPRMPLDNFVLARLEQAKLSPAPAADRRTLARRLFIQLIGLPPTPERLAEFLADERVDATERLVDELLRSPHFGERWGRHWLDLARYADSNGLDENFLFREAWRYRNRVIECFNADMPYDRLLVEQIAGDLLPHDSLEQRDRQRISAGFLLVGPKVLLGNNDDERRMDIADEQLDTIGRTVLGQTLGCARCHDHKFDPIPTADYYALAGIFTSTEVMERRYMLGEQRMMERLVGIGEQDGSLDDAYEKYWRDKPALTEKAKQSKVALELLEKGDEEGLQKQVKEKAESVAVEARDASASKETRLAAQKQLVAQDAKATEAPPIPPRAMIPRDVEKPRDEQIRLSGQFNSKGIEVPRGFLQVISDQRVAIPAEVSGRLEFARWLTDTKTGAGHLAARVLVNRVWHHLIGQGLVRTVDNFGRTGEAPSHPELIDHLADELIAANWSIKSLIRTMVLSRTFAMSSQHNETAQAIDPENRLLWRANRRRLDPETLRDAMLQAAGTLNLKPLDSTVSYLGDQATAVGANTNRRRTDFPNRSIYLPVIRNDLPEIFDAFNFADPQTTTGRRPETMVATQGLFVLNDESVMTAAESTAKRLLNEVTTSDEARIDRMYELMVGSPPDDDERRQLVSFISTVKQQLGISDPAVASEKAWAIAAHALLASSRFQIVE